MTDGHVPDRARGRPKESPGWLIFDGCLSGRESGDWDSERRTGDVIEVGPMEEANRARVASVLTTDTDLEVVFYAAPKLDCHFDKLANSGLVERLERV